MASFASLVQLNNDGDLGQMLARRFGGERRYIRPRADADLIISFRSEAETPSVGAIEQAVSEHYSQLGYTVEPDGGGGDMYCCRIFFGSRAHGLVSVIISTFYPLTPGWGHNNLRLTTGIIG